MIRKVALANDGSITCACGLNIHFLPPELPGGGPNSVNHPGCSAAEAGASPAGPDMDGKYETINLIDRSEVKAFYAKSAPKDGAVTKADVEAYLDAQPAEGAPA